MQAVKENSNDSSSGPSEEDPLEAAAKVSFHNHSINTPF